MVWENFNSNLHDNIIKDVMREHGMTVSEAFDYLYSQTPMHDFSVDTLIEYYEIKQLSHTLSVEETKICELLISIRSYHKCGAIPIPDDLDTPEKFVNWCRAIS